MHGGRIAGVVDPRAADRYEVGRMMLGAHGPVDEALEAERGAA